MADARLCYSSPVLKCAVSESSRPLCGNSGTAIGRALALTVLKHAACDCCRSESKRRIHVSAALRLTGGGAVMMWGGRYIDALEKECAEYERLRVLLRHEEALREASGQSTQAALSRDCRGQSAWWRMCG